MVRVLMVVIVWRCTAMSEGKSVRVGAKVEVVGKGVIGTVAYIGTTLFSSGRTLLTSLMNIHVTILDKSLALPEG